MDISEEARNLFDIDIRAERFICNGDTDNFRADYKFPNIFELFHDNNAVFSYLMEDGGRRGKELVWKLFINTREKRCGLTLLHFAVSCLSPQEMKMLLDAGADINMANERGFTVLHSLMSNECVRHHNYIECIHTVMQYGADPTIKNINGKTPWDLWMENTHRVNSLDEEIQDLLFGPLIKESC